MFTTLQEATERRNADMSRIATIISDELHQRGWGSQINPHLQEINAALTIPLTLTTRYPVTVRVRVNFTNSQSAELRTTRSAYVDDNFYTNSTLIAAAYDYGDWDSPIHDDPFSASLDSISSIVFRG